MCAGQGHEVIGALQDHARRGDVTGLLVERDPGHVAAARRQLRPAQLGAVRAEVGDAAVLDAYPDPAVSGRPAS